MVKEQELSFKLVDLAWLILDSWCDTCVAILFWRTYRNALFYLAFPIWIL